MSTTVAKSLRIDKIFRPDANTSIDVLFDELVRDADWVKGLLDFAHDLYTENNTDKVDASAVMAFVDSVRLPMCNVVDAIAPIIFETARSGKDGDRCANRQMMTMRDG